LSELTPKGRLYAVETPLRPVGLGGALAMTLDDFGRHFHDGAAPLWQWQALCQARAVYGEPPAREASMHLVERLLRQRGGRQTDMTEMRQTRLELERGASEENLKRAAGGTLDVEFLVQVLQLGSAADQPAVLTPNTEDAIGALAAAGALEKPSAERLTDNYRFLRRVESGLRLLNTSARHDLPTGAQELAQLAYLLGHSNPERLRQQCREAMADNRALFDRLTTGE
jgi:glutamate-ammonia-ligase adenylyltransferase